MKQMSENYDEFVSTPEIENKIEEYANKTLKVLEHLQNE